MDGARADAYTVQSDIYGLSIILAEVRVYNRIIVIMFSFLYNVLTPLCVTACIDYHHRTALRRAAEPSVGAALAPAAHSREPPTQPARMPACSPAGNYSEGLGDNSLRAS